MGGLEIFIMGFATFFNLAIVKWKFEQGRTTDGSLDLAMLIVLGWLFSGSTGGLAMGTVASALFSVYLIFAPPSFDFDSTEDKKKDTTPEPKSKNIFYS